MWDWNGTLLADVDAVVAATRAGLAAAGMPMNLDLARYRSTFRRPLSEFYEALVGRAMDEVESSALGDAFAEHYRAAEPSLPLADGATDGLDRLARTGVGQSLLSLHGHDEVVATLERRGLTRWFARIDGDRARDGGGKAAALAAHVAALEVAPRDVVLIGDTVDDARACADVGTGCVLVAEYSTHHAADLRAVRPGVPVVETLREAVDRVLDPG